MPAENPSTRRRAAHEVPDVPCPLPFPWSVLGPLASGAGVVALYVNTLPEEGPGEGEVAAIKAFLSVVIGTQLLSTIAGFLTHGKSDSGIVDRIWSIVPFVYVWTVYAYHDGSSEARLRLMCFVSTLWGARLTWNFWRKGGYNLSAEDYRWAIVRSWYPGIQFELFNLIFVTCYQHLILFAIVSPAIIVERSSASDLGLLDVAASSLFLVLLLLEHVADAQMFDFQTEKYRRKGAGESLQDGDFKRGFITSGVWGYSRHPNYFAEVSMWWAFYLFAVAASGEWVNIALCGPVLIFLLFVPPGASLALTETLSLQKYPAYAEYQRETSRFFPWFPSSKEA